MAPEIVGIGLVTIDHLYRLQDVSDLPKGQVLDYSIQGGGPAATAMAAVATLGTECAFIGAVGDDERGKKALQQLHSQGVDTSRTIVKAKRDTPLVMVLVDGKTGERHFLGLQGEPPRLATEDIDWDSLNGTGIFHMDNWVEDIGAMLARAKNCGATTIVDTEFRANHFPTWLQNVDVFIAGGDHPEWRGNPEAARAQAEALARCGPRVAILTLGSAGAVGTGPAGPFSVPGFAVEVVDTCGTGDVFHGSYVFALHKGWEPSECATFAAATAALSAMRLGGRAGLPTAARVARFLAERNLEGPWREHLNKQ